MARLVAAVALVLAVCARAPGQRAGVFDLPADRVTGAVVTRGDGAPAAAGSPMLGALTGVLAELRGRDLLALRATVPPNPFLGEPAGGARVGVVHLTGAGGKAKRVELVKAVDGSFVAVEMDGDRPVRAELKQEETLALIAGWPAYRGSFAGDGCADPRGVVFELPKPYVPGRYTMDLETIGERFLRGRKTGLNAATRELDTSVLWARLPAGERPYDPRTPAGLLVWIDARMGDDGGRPPEVFAPSLDALGVICVGAGDSGNDRYVVDRYQLALDTVATATARYHIDPRRVYVTGISGGARVASILQGCFPDIFTGSAPIVGLEFYENVPLGTGKWVRAGYLRPRAGLFRVLQERPIAPITGPHDGNYNSIKSATYLMERDGLRVRLFEYPDMGHEMPTPERFTEALVWVDNVYQRARQAEIDAGATGMEAYRKRWNGDPPPDEAARQMLVTITREGPWTEQAWTAAELLGVTAP